MMEAGLAHAIRVGDVLVRGLSSGRRQRCRPMLGEGRGFATDLRDVYLPWPLPSVLIGSGFSAALALQAAPSKELIAELPLAGLSARERSALQRVEGAIALAWASRHWPGLHAVLHELTPGLDRVDELCTSSEQMLQQALRLARSAQRLSVPIVLGQLPLVRSALLDLSARRMQMEARVPWSHEKRLERLSRWSIAVAGNGGDTGAKRAGTPDLDEEERLVTNRKARVGTPYPEWNVLSQRYREDHVSVVESRHVAGKPRSAVVDPRLASWFEQPIERRWKQRLDDGSDIDIDALIEARADDLAGQQHLDRVYRERLPGARNVSCALLLDRSNSLVEADNLRHELACANALAAAMDRAGERYGVFAFWGDTRHHVAVEVLRDFDDGHRLSFDEQALQPRGYTRIGAALRHLTARLRLQSSERRVLMVLGDAIPCDEGYEGEYAVADVLKAVEEAELGGVTVAFIAVGNPAEDPLAEGLRGRFTRVTSTQDLAPVLAEIHARLAA